MSSIHGNRPVMLARVIDEALSTVRTKVCDHPASMLALVAVAGMGMPFPSSANTYTVNTSGDPGPLGTVSLRQAITSANAAAGNVVQFSPALIGSTITLVSGEIAITKPMTVSGPGADALTISGNDVSRIFYIRAVPDDAVPSHMQVNISGVTLTKGHGSFAGGAIFAEHAQLGLSYSTISASKAGFFGGGLYSVLGNPTVQHCRLIANQAVYGGAFTSVGDAAVNLLFDTISGNSAAEQGGGVFISGSPSALIGRSTISGNMVLQPDVGSNTQGGGGVAFANMVVNGTANVYESTITQNYSPSGGGGIALLDAQSGNAARVYFSTIVGNSAAVDETGIGITSAGGTVTIYNTIAANNFSQSGADDLAGSFKSRQSLIKSPGSAIITGTGSVIGVDPQLGPLADNGGSTLTMLPSATSPAVHGVTCSACVSFVVLDQRGAIRHNPSDIGAVERQYPEDLVFRDGFGGP